MKIHNNEKYQFADELKYISQKEHNIWEVLIVDPDDKIHKLATNSLQNFCFMEKEIIFLTAKSTVEAKKIIADHTDLTVIIMNAAEDHVDATRELVKYIREVLKNNITRLILNIQEERAAFSTEFIFQYDISDCQDILQHSEKKYFSILLTALRHYCDLVKIEKSKVDNRHISAAANRFVPQAFLKILKKNSIVEMNLNDYAEVDLSILFLDIRSFTSLSEFLTPMETFQFINHCLSYLEPYIRANNGFIDKYIGDSIMALFRESPDDAVRAGIQMIDSLESYNFDRIKKRQVPIQIGIGINTGLVIIGIVGFHDRMECTVIGDTVNVASRVEKLNKFMDTHLLINEKTFLNLKNPDQFHIRSLGKQKIYGKMQFHTVYEVYDNNPEHVKMLKEKTLNEFTQAIQAFQARDFLESQRIFKQVLKINRHDSVAKYYCEKLTELLKK